MSAILCLALACGPGKPDDAAGDTTDATTTANITTGAGTTTAAPPTTDGSTTGGDASTGGDATTGIDGQPPSVVVLLSGALSGDELPAFAGLRHQPVPLHGRRRAWLPVVGSWFRFEDSRS